MGEIIFRFHQFVDNTFIKDRKVLLLWSSGALGRELDAQLKALKVPVLSADRSNFDIEDSKENMPNVVEFVPFDLAALTLFYHLTIKPRVIKPML